MIKAQQRPPKVIFPGLLWYFLFLVIPLCIVLVFSVLHKGSYGKIDLQLDLTNYKKIFEPIYIKIIFRSMFLATYTTLLCLVLAFPLTYYMARSSKRVKRIFLGLIMVPFWTNFVIRVYALKLVLANNGLINRFLLNNHWIDTPLQLTDNSIGVAIGMIYNYLPFMVLPLYVSLERMDFTLLDAAYDLGANKWQTAIRVLFPLSLPGITTGSIFVFIPALGEFVIPDLMGGSQAMYVGNLITETFLKLRDWPFGCALSSFLVLMAMMGFMIVLSKPQMRIAK